MCDYIVRISDDICWKKLEYFIAQIDEMKQIIEGYGDVAWGILLCSTVCKVARIARRAQEIELLFLLSRVLTLTNSRFDNFEDKGNSEYVAR